MALEGKIKNRNGQLYVLYTTTLSSEPRRLYKWYRVTGSYSNRYGNARPADGDRATYAGTGQWSTTDGNGSTGRVETEDNATIEEVGVEPPPSRGKDLRWHDGQWEKLMKSGWVAAGEGRASGKRRVKQQGSVRVGVAAGIAAAGAAIFFGSRGRR